MMTMYLYSLLQSMSALLSLFGQSAEFLNTPVVQSILAPGMEIAVRYVQKLDENELKDKVSTYVCTLCVVKYILYPGRSISTYETEVHTIIIKQL